MNELYATNIDFNDVAKRNITHIEKDFNPFSDLVDDLAFNVVAEKAILHTRQRMNMDTDLQDFYYTAAVTYPFETEPFMHSRYSDGSYPVWYGSLDVTTTIAETVYHTFEDIYAIDGVAEFGFIKRKRAIYEVNCKGLLLDLSVRAKEYPDLLSNDYRFCQSMGKRIKEEAWSGCLSQSARAEGLNLNIFNREILSNPKLIQKISYEISLKDAELRVYSDENTLIYQYQRYL